MFYIYFDLICSVIFLCECVCEALCNCVLKSAIYKALLTSTMNDLQHINLCHFVTVVKISNFQCL